MKQLLSLLLFSMGHVVVLSAQSPEARHLKEEISFYMDVTVHAESGDHRVRAKEH